MNQLFLALLGPVQIALDREPVAGFDYAAAWLYAAAKAIREQIGSPVMPGDRPAYELALAGMRTRLGPCRFVDLWVEGRARQVMRRLRMR